MTKETSAKSEAGKIAKAVGILSSATMLSRVLGLVRDVITAALFGAGGALDAFFVAWRLPNMLRSLFAEGSLTVAFVPVYSEVMEKEGEEAAHNLGRIAFTILTILLIVVVIVGVLAAPWIIRVLAMGFAEDPEKFALTVTLARMVFPYIGLISLTALAGGILNARGIFLYPAIAPVVLNIVIIAMALLLAPFMGTPVMSLAVGVILGGFCQLALQIRPLLGTGHTFTPVFDFKNKALHRVLLLMGPSVFGVAVYQFNLVISTFIASWLREGSISFLYYAERLFQLPLGVFAVSIGVASLPSLSRLAARDDWEGFHETVRGAARLLWFVVLPASVGLVVMAEPISALLFERGKFTPEMTIGTADALRFYALAMLPVATSRVFAQGFYALKDTKTPVYGAFWSLFVNLGASLILAFPLGLGHAGLALATAISATVYMGYLARKYYQKTGKNPFVGLMAPLKRMGAAAVGMGALVGVIGGWLEIGAGSGIPSLILGVYVLGLVFGGAAFYAAAGVLLGLPDLKELLTKLRGKKVAAS